MNIKLMHTEQRICDINNAKLQLWFKNNINQAFQFNQF